MTYHIYVSGRVQGVGYRRFAQKQADGFKLRGWARNHYDGRVEITVEGPENELDQFCNQLRKGPLFSQVLEVIVITVEEPVAQENFEILPDLEVR